MARSFLKHLIPSGAALAAALFGLSAANAERPQVLMVVSAPESLPLMCEGGTCWTEASSICLEPNKPSPRSGHAYVPAAEEAGGIFIEGTGVDGKVTRIAAGDLIRIGALRGHSAVKISIDAGALKKLGLTDARLTMPERLVALPRSEQPVAAADVTPFAQIAGQVLTEQSTRVEAAHLTARMLRLLPSQGRIAKATRVAVWDQAMASQVAASPAATEIAREAWQDCLEPYQSMYQCLGGHHDILIGDTNDAYWDRLKIAF